MTFGPTGSYASYLPTEVELPEDKSKMGVVYSERERRTADILNLKENGQYEPSELMTNQTWFTTANNQTKRYSFRKVFETGAIAAGATVNIAHGVTGNPLFFTKIYGTCVTDVVDYRPIPFASTAAVNQQISVLVAGANIVIINGAASPNITSGIVVLEYLRN